MHLHRAGNGDKFTNGRNLKPSPFVLRANTSEEASPDLQSPVFSRCTHPLVLWTRWAVGAWPIYLWKQWRMPAQNVRMFYLQSAERERLPSCIGAMHEPLLPMGSHGIHITYATCVCR